MAESGVHAGSAGPSQGSDPISHAFCTLVKVDIHQLKAVCAQNSHPNGNRAAVLAIFEQQIDTLGALLSSASPNVAFAEKTGQQIDRAVERFIANYAQRIEEMEEYFPGLSGEVRKRLFGRAEHWKAAALLNGLSAEGAAPQSIDAASANSSSSPNSGDGTEPPVPTDQRKSEPEVDPKPKTTRQHGFKADMERHVRIANVVEKYAPHWRTSNSWRTRIGVLSQITRDLDQIEEEVPIGWRSGETPALDGAAAKTWSEALEMAKTGNKLVADQIRNSLDVVRKADAPKSSQ